MNRKTFLSMIVAFFVKKPEQSTTAQSQVNEMAVLITKQTAEFNKALTNTSRISGKDLYVYIDNKRVKANL